MIRPIERTRTDPPSIPSPVRPIANCYWAAPGLLLAGEYPGDKTPEQARAKLRALLEAGVRAFIDLSHEDDGMLPYAQWIGAAAHRRFPMPDFSVPDSPMQTKAILDEIDERVAKAELVYLHCWGGIGRTGLIVGCWLARHGLEGRAALECLRELWKHCPKSATRKSPETAQQEEYIIHWTEPE